MLRRVSEKGFALPITIFVVTLLTVMLAASFARTGAEFRIADASNDVVTAFGVAQSGLQTYLGMSRNARPADGDSLRINVTGGYADVVAQLLRNDTLAGSWMYLIRSVGHVIRPAQGAEPRAVRTVAQFAEWQWGNIREGAAVSSLTDIDGADGDMVVSAVDQCAQDPTITGVRAPTPSDVSDITATGAPAFNIGGNSATVGAETGIDWQAILDGAILPDHTALIPNDTTFSTYVINSLEVDAENIRGTGLLIISDELDTGNDAAHRYFEWDGIVLLGGWLDADAEDSTVIRGLLVTGLNKLTSGVAPNFTLDDDPIRVYYNSCNIQRALRPLRGFIPVRNGWIDNWATY